MNGQVKRAKKGSRELIQPGCEVIVPVKAKSNWSLPVSYTHLCSVYDKVKISYCIIDDIYYIEK